MQRIPAANPEVLRRMNDDSTFWITTRNALLTSTFVVLGQKSVHNIDKLLGATPSRSKSAEVLYRESGNVLYGLVDP
jgi:hypothetical protein